MQEVVLVRYGEIILKGLNRPIFEEKLRKNIRAALKNEKIKIWYSQARIYVEPVENEEFNVDRIIEKLTKVYGVVSVSPSQKIESSIDEIKKAALFCLNDSINRENIKTFKVETKRGDKNFPMTSPEISAEIGGVILDKFTDLRVDVHNPDITVYIEVRENTYIYTKIYEGCGGMPVGTNGKAMLLVSGGIDSPVAGWMIAKRGVQIEAIHFFSPPYTGQKAKEKVIDLCKILARYTGRVRLHLISFTDIQVEIRDKCPEEQLTILMRRFMMRIAERIAVESECSALITGENLGQVASQTMQGLVASNSVVKMPVFRPLIGMDKNEIVTMARKIDTYETSILPYEDCCTIFLPKRPETKPRVEKLEMSESHLDIEKLINDAISNREIVDIR